LNYDLHIADQRQQKEREIEQTIHNISIKRKTVSSSSAANSADIIQGAQEQHQVRMFFFVKRMRCAIVSMEQLALFEVVVGFLHMLIDSHHQLE
jgi:hypothetical protein